MKDEGLLAPEAVVLLRGRGCCGGVVGFGLGQAEVVAAAAPPGQERPQAGYAAGSGRGGGGGPGAAPAGQDGGGHGDAYV